MHEYVNLYYITIWSRVSSFGFPFRRNALKLYENVLLIIWPLVEVFHVDRLHDSAVNLRTDRKWQNLAISGLWAPLPARDWKPDGSSHCSNISKNWFSHFEPNFNPWFKVLDVQQKERQLFCEIFRVHCQPRNPGDWRKLFDNYSNDKEFQKKVLLYSTVPLILPRLLQKSCQDKGHGCMLKCPLSWQIFKNLVKIRGMALYIYIYIIVFKNLKNVCSLS